jgi:GT2 family glycosyltransferase
VQSLPFVASFTEILQRLRYRRGELRRIAPVRMEAGGGSSGTAGFEWTSEQVRGLMQEALGCPVPSQVVYDVVLLPEAVVRSWCAVDHQAASTHPIVFEIEAQAGGRTASGSLTVTAAASGTWQALDVAAPGRGPARILLRVRPAAGSPAASGRAFWAHPRIESPRPFDDVVRGLRSAFTRGAVGLPAAAPSSAEQIYAAHARTVRPSRSVLRAQRAEASGRTRLITLVTFVGAADSWYAETAESVLAQSYLHWEWLIVANDAAGVSAIRRLARDRRVRVIAAPVGVERAGAWAEALANATGEFVALLDAGDTLSPDALFEVAAVVDGPPRADVVYSDEDQVVRGKRTAPSFKPDWSPERLLSSNYIGRLAAIRREAAGAAGGFREHAADPEWDLLLRLSRSAARFRRVPRCLYHRRATDRPPASRAGCADVAAHVAALGRHAEVVAAPGGCRVVWPASGRLVSIIIPNRDALAVLRLAVDGVLRGTKYPAKELIIVDNGSTDPEVLALYHAVERSGEGRIVPFPGAFNFSAACNRGAAAARGELLLFLNNDIEVVDPSWIDELVGWAELPEIGIVGAKLLYPDRTIQHAGVVFGIGLVGHIFARAAEGTSTAFGSPESYRNYLAVTGACQMMRRDVFNRLGGFDERFRLSFSDVVLCMEAWKAGYRVVYTPYARLVHHESYSRKKEDSAMDMLLLARYLEAEQFSEDPFFHPELDPKSSTPAVRPPLDAAARQVVSNYVERVLASAMVEN